VPSWLGELRGNFAGDCEVQPLIPIAAPDEVFEEEGVADIGLE
jgi:hypothetical protein